MKLFGNSELYAISENKGSENGTSETPSNTVASTTVAATSNGKMTTPVKSGRAANRSAPLSCPTKFGFSLGHFFNDMSSSVWFSYSLLFFKLYFSNSMAGALILIGQVADALATPFVGYYSDKQKCNERSNFLLRMGRRKFWHMLGTVLLLFAFPLVYVYPLLLPENTDAFRHFTIHLVVYVFLIAMFQMAWAMVQVSHVSLITDLTSVQNERVALNAYRQAATVASNLFVYALMLILLKIFADGGGTFSAKDAKVVAMTTVISCVVGIMLSILFHILVKEPGQCLFRRKKRGIIRPGAAGTGPVFTTSLGQTPHKDGQTETADYLTGNFKQLQVTDLPKLEANEEENGGDNVGELKPRGTYKKHSTIKKKGSRLSLKRMAVPVRRMFSVDTRRQFNCKDWLKCSTFWKVAVIYMMSRLYFNLSQAYTTLYLTYTLKLDKSSIASIPFVIYSTGFLFSMVARPISASIGSRSVLLIGCIFSITSCVWLSFGSETNEDFKRWQVYGATAFNGAGCTAILIASMAITADLIGDNAKSAFVFGAMGFFDKLINGAAVYVLELLNPETPSYYQNVLVYVAGCGVIFTLVGLYAIRTSSIGKVKEQHQKEGQVNLGFH